MRKLILIRGLGRDQRHWGGLLAEIQKELKSFEVECVDLVGFGTFSELKVPLNIAEMTEALLEELPGEPVDILGLSLGAMVVMDLVDRYPERVNKYILMNSSLSSLSRASERFNLKLLAPILKQLVSSTPESIERLITEVVFSHDKKAQQEAFKHWTQIQAQTPISKAAFLRQIYAASQYKGPKKLKKSGLVLTGVKDKLVSTNCSNEIAKYYGLPLLSHPQAGHDPLDAADWFINQLQNFFQ